MKITKQDEQALRAALRRKPRKVHELRTLLGRRLFAAHATTTGRSTVNYFGPEATARRLTERAINRTADNAVARLLGEWKRQGLVDNPVRGTWQWVGK